MALFRCKRNKNVQLKIENVLVWMWQVVRKKDVAAIVASFICSLVCE